MTAMCKTCDWWRKQNNSAGRVGNCQHKKMAFRGGIADIPLFGWLPELDGLTASNGDEPHTGPNYRCLHHELKATRHG